MSCVGKELVQDAAKFPIVDVVDEKDLVTDAVLLQVSYILNISTVAYLDLWLSVCDSQYCIARDEAIFANSFKIFYTCEFLG